MYEACTLAVCLLHYIAVALTILPVTTIEGAVSARRIETKIFICYCGLEIMDAIHNTCMSIVECKQDIIEGCTYMYIYTHRC